MSDSSIARSGKQVPISPAGNRTTLNEALENLEVAVSELENRMNQRIDTVDSSIDGISKGIEELNEVMVRLCSLVGESSH